MFSSFFSIFSSSSSTNNHSDNNINNSATIVPDNIPISEVDDFIVVQPKPSELEETKESSNNPKKGRLPAPYNPPNQTEKKSWSKVALEMHEQLHPAALEAQNRALDKQKLHISMFGSEPQQPVYRYNVPIVLPKANSQVRVR